MVHESETRDQSGSSTSGILLRCRLSSNPSERPGCEGKVGGKSCENDETDDENCDKKNSDNWDVLYRYYDSISGSDLDSIEHFFHVVGSFEAPL